MTFVLYYFIDIKNFEITRHQESAEKEYLDFKNVYWIDYRERVSKKNPTTSPPENRGGAKRYLSIRAPIYGPGK
jgi:hypothetical protein